MPSSAKTAALDLKSPEQIVVVQIGSARSSATNAASEAATLTAAPKFGSVQAYSPKHLAETILTFKSALENPDLTGQNFLIGYFLLGIRGVAQTSTRRVQVV